MREVVEYLVEYFEVDGVFISVLLDLMPRTDALTQEVSKVGLPQAALAILVVGLVYGAHVLLHRAFNKNLTLGKNQ